jgi:hypothetical protein
MESRVLISWPLHSRGSGKQTDGCCERQRGSEWLGKKLAEIVFTEKRDWRCDPTRGVHCSELFQIKACNVGMAFVAPPLLLGLPLSPPPCPPLLFSPSLVEPVLASRASQAACEGTRLLSADLSTSFGSNLVFDVLFRLEHSTHCGSGLGKVSHTFSVC